MIRVVIDTNVVIAALRSRRGASFQLLRRVGMKEFQMSLSVPLVLEYEEAGKRVAREAGLTAGDVDDVVDYLCSEADLRDIHYLWRPFLRDPDDDHLLELAVESGSQWIIAFNVRDFAGIGSFGIGAVTPGEFLGKLEEGR